MAWSTPDISTVTDTLHDLLTTALSNAMNAVPPQIPNFTVNVNMASPDLARNLSPCQLSLYLLHVGRDPYWRNTPVAGPRPQLNSAQPLSLNLYYLLTAWADKFYDQEQQAMTVALQFFHSNPIYRHLTGGAVDEEFTLSVEADTIEEMSRLWQAFTVPMRLSCVVKVGVVFVAPATLPPPIARPPVTANVAVGPQGSPGDLPVLYAAMNLAFAPYPAPTDPKTEMVTGGELVAVASSPVVAPATPSSNILVRGASLRDAGIGQPNATQVFLSTPDGATEWRLGPTWRQSTGDDGLLELVLPTSYAASPPSTSSPLTRTPPPGVYRLAVGSNTPPPKVRSNRIPLVIAARIDGMTGPVGGAYTLSGAGFAAGSTTVGVGGVDVTPSASVTPGSITFTPPGGLASPGTYPVAVVVNGVPCLPGPVVTL